mgnify:CR=1 FL=1
MQLYSIVHFFYTLLDPKASEKKVGNWSELYSEMKYNL